MKRAINGYYFSRKPVTVLGVDTYAVIARDDSGKFWRLRLEDMALADIVRQTKRGCKAALDMLVAGSLDVLTEVF